uniref:Uncharacterized protein n=1 Tax=Rhizophora mucronata TaxID=61149 RepID=A0A2P2PH44_RHIMU
MAHIYLSLSSAIMYNFKFPRK